MPPRATVTTGRQKQVQVLLFMLIRFSGSCRPPSIGSRIENKLEFLRHNTRTPNLKVLPQLRA